MNTTKREKPILFSGPMVRAILEGRKTQTRRVAPIIWDTSKHWGDYDCWTFQRRGKPLIGFSTRNRGQETLTGFCPYGQPGERLWVKETWQSGDYAMNEPRGAVYRATDPDWETVEGWRWKPSIFMPRWASRITLEIVDVRVERLHDISEADAKAEGVEWYPALKPIPLYEDLWESINGAGSWAKNPWVWVIEFSKV